MQLSLFPDLVPPARQGGKQRHAYTMTEYRQVQQDYTHGWLKGPEMAKRLDVPYPSFRKFIIRNPELCKRQIKESP